MYDFGVFAALAHEVRDLRIPLDGPALAEAVAIRDQLDAAITQAAGEFDAAELWDLDAATSMHAWLREHTGMTSRQAARTVAVSRRLRSLPVTAAAWRDGSLTSGQIDAIVANVPRRHLELFAEQEAAIVPSLAGLPTDDTVIAMQHWRAKADGTDDPPTDREPTRSLHLSSTLDGRGVLDGDLDPDTFALVRTALRVAETRDLDGEPRRSPAERRADALGDVAKFFLDHQHTRPGGRHRPHLNVIVDLDTWEGRYADGGAITGHVLDELCCDSTLHRVLRDSRSVILDYGTATRVLTAALWAALVMRDEHCRFPGCDRPAHWCDGHHITWFSRGGATRLDNLVLLCRRHHKRLHHPGWEAKLLPDATFEVTDPTGTVRTSHPPGTLAPFP